MYTNTNTNTCVSVVTLKRLSKSNHRLKKKLLLFDSFFFICFFILNLWLLFDKAFV